MVPQACSKSGARALATSRWPDQRRDLAFPSGKGHSIKGGFIACSVREANVVEDDVVFDGRERLATRCLARVEHFVQACDGDVRHEDLRDEGK